MFSHLKARDIAQLSLASPRYGVLARSHMGFKRGVLEVSDGQGAASGENSGAGDGLLPGGEEGHVDVPRELSTASSVPVGSQILIPVLGKEPSCFRYRATDGRNLGRQVISFGSLRSSWRPLIAPSVAIG